ncbi:SusC/RagA family TonB-linked outer membrane protein [Ancylomarina sp. 16SWW S1-10-2]|uniref:SusC/RagA family TonB-linked outer membrane protein n=1 Tax=Ancylomarina sp. 16SWW S1-10-2 TaxID=2499681 RepID=UPI00189F1CD8|nr:SusC/RagA family TonB-linked outer membrane protein [Ancylomarina sp. 16SWW S1-10-2]
MRNFIILFFVFNLSAFANGFSQKVSQAQYDRSTLVEVFEHLMGETGYGILYKKSEINPDVRVSLDVENSSVQEILDKVLMGTELSYKVQDEVIVIFHQEKLAEPVIETPQEKKKLKGTVLDEDGNTLPGVSVVVKGTTIGAATDIDGNYMISFDQKNAILVYSFVGMIPQEIAYTGQVLQNVTLLADAEQMAEVVVTGYQTISKERATGSFVTLNSDNISNSPNESIGDNLESLVAGLQTTVDEDGDIKITIRGESSLTGNIEPLVVVDGFAVDGGFETINRNDIDKITVLKDAAAASIWGAQAANGVIVITTKKGNKDKGIQVNFEAYTKMSDDVDLDYANPIANSATQLQYEMLSWQLGYMTPSYDIGNIQSNMTKGSELFQKQLKEYVADGGVGLPTFTMTPELQKLAGLSYKGQVKSLMLRKPVSQNYNLTIRGQGERNQYAFSVMYNDNKQVMKEDSDDNLLVNFRNSMKVAKWLDFDFSVMTQLKNEKSGGIGLNHIKRMAPYELLVDENGNYNHINTNLYQPFAVKNKEIIDQMQAISDGWAYEDMTYNPLREMRSQDFRTKTFNARLKAGLNFKIADGIKYSVGMQYSRGNIDVKNRYKEDAYYVRGMVNEYSVADYDAFVAGTPQTIGEYQLPKGEMAYLKNIQTRAYVIRNQFSFDKVYGDHAINFIAGTELNWNVVESNDNWLYGYNHDKYTTGMPSAYTDVSRMFYSNPGNIPRGGVIDYKTNKFFSLYSNMAYTYKDRYSLSASVRTDASNITVKDPKYRYEPFWSVGASWQLGKEDFAMQYDWLNRAILRATYGANGNIPMNTAQVPLISYVDGSSGFGSYGNGVDHANLNDLGNPTLGWEKVKQLNLALDFAVLGNKLFGTIEYYNKKSESLVAEVSLPSISGTDSQAFNIAEMSNKGIELNLNANLKITKDLVWRPIFNFAYNKNMVSKVNVTDLELYKLRYDTPYVQGYGLNPVWSYNLTGDTNEFGIPMIMGKNGVEYPANVNISATGIYGPDLVHHRGSTVAPYVTSFTNEFKFKGFSLLATVTGKFGHYMYNNSHDFQNRVDAMNYHEDMEYLIDGRADEIGMLPIPTERISGIESYYSSVLFLDSRVEKADYIRLKEVMLSYHLPKSLVSKLGVNRVKFYTHISNVGLLWTANDKNIDPEYQKGLNFFKPERTFTFGVNVNF